MTTTDFEFYTNKYYGNVIPFSLYNKYELKARASVDKLSLKRINDMDDNVKKMCMCSSWLFVWKKYWWSIRYGNNRHYVSIPRY